MDEGSKLEKLAHKPFAVGLLANNFQSCSWPARAPEKRVDSWRQMTEDWRNCIDSKEAVAAVAADLSKTFDAINHRLSESGGP